MIVGFVKLRRDFPEKYFSPLTGQDAANQIIAN
jgi:hypothetical protein